MLTESPTAEGRDWSIDGLNQDTLAVELWNENRGQLLGDGHLDREAGFKNKKKTSPDNSPYLVTSLRIQQDPSKLNDLGRVLCHIDAVFVAGGSYVYDDVTVEVRGGSGSVGGHV